jgi:hypothetical protein
MTNPRFLALISSNKKILRGKFEQEGWEHFPIAKELSRAYMLYPKSVIILTSIIFTERNKSNID